MVTVEGAKVELTLNRPIDKGFAILDLSKMLMYDLFIYLFIYFFVDVFIALQHWISYIILRIIC